MTEQDSTEEKKIIINERHIFTPQQIDLMAKAVDMMRDHQLRGVVGIQRIMAETPREIFDRVWKGDRIDKHVREWDEQMTYYYLLADIAQRLERIKWIQYNLVAVKDPDKLVEK